MLRRGGTWSVTTHDWPVGVGTTSESMSRARRYSALNEIGADQPPPPDERERQRPDQGV